MKKIVMSLLAVMIALPVFAEGKYSIKELTPEVQSALDNRRERFDQLRALKTAGEVGENNKGYVDSLKSGPAVDSIVVAENQDRKTIYQTIAQQNGLEDAVGTIESVFAQVQRDKASAGEQIQMEDGNWTAK